MTLLFPLLGNLFASLSRRIIPNKSPTQDNPISLDAEPNRLTVLVPAHNEDEVLSLSLKSMQAAISRVKGLWSGEIRICVGADGCTDNTAVMARSLGVDVIEFPSKQGKWPTLCSLAKQNKNCDWFILADSDIHWSDNFFIKLLPHLGSGSVMSVAPTFVDKEGGILERFKWWLERHLKIMEGRSGGPISVHGATVCYRSEEFLIAIESLSGMNWLNDDVVLPLRLRGLFPNLIIKYVPDIIVHEIQRNSLPSFEFNRRRRIVCGNVTWIKHLWLPLWDQNLIAALLASRRVFRLIWAYWFVLLVSCLVYLLYIETGPSTWILFALFSAVMLVALSFSRQGRGLTQSALASLLVPYYIFALNINSPSETSLWK